MPIIIGAISVTMLASLRKSHHEYRPFLLSLLLFALCFVGLGISMFPYIIPPHVTILEAATPFRSQIFMFVGACVLIPLILGYTAFAYWVFRGKVENGRGSSGFGWRAWPASRLWRV
jgi:cytochrome d ubiquinol oxidase subunit II